MVARMMVANRANLNSAEWLKPGESPVKQPCRRKRLAKILVVDDAAFMRMRCTKLLADNGFEVAEAADGAEAIERYKEHKPDGVLLDITMPNMDGLSTLKELIKMDPGARIAMVTAMGQQSMVMEALKTGARDFVVKPFDAERVLAAVKKMIS
jgi:two-component system, chemotaxis family, chemotaxis protein CheY